MQSLREIYESHTGHLLNKWEHYIDIYDQHFSKYRNTDFVFVEIGVAHGGSLQMWRKYFGEQATIIGIDVNPECKQFEKGKTKVFIGSQQDPVFLENLKKEIPRIDVLLDDGGHTMKQQITTFHHLFDYIKEDGLYVCEDLHTSYWYEFGGGFKNKNSFIEFSKNFIDNINGFHATKRGKSKMYNKITESVFSIFYYDSMIFIQKKKMTKPYVTFKGEAQIQNHFIDYGTRVKLTNKIRALLGIKRT